MDFPVITVRDVVNVHEILRNHLGINRIHTIIGASIGGYQALEYSIMYPDLFRDLFLLLQVQNSLHGLLLSMNRSDLQWKPINHFSANDPEGGKKGLKAARSIALLSYQDMHMLITRHRQKR